MATEQEIKQEILSAIPESSRAQCLPEIEKWATTDNLDGKTILQKFYSQWKSGKKGHQNRVNSWTAYYLGVTTKKPEIDSPFHPRRRAFARPSPPDIDSDFDYRRRQEVVDYIVSRYGRYNVGNVGTYGALKMRSCLTRIIKTLDIANAYKDGKDAWVTENVNKVTEILSTLPRQRGALMKVNDSETGEEVVLKTTKDVIKANSSDCDDFRSYMKQYPEIIQHTNNVEGLLSIFGVHASGLVVSDVPLNEIAPLRTAKDTAEGTVSLATQFAYEDLETLGLIKFDILGISTLTVISECVELIKDNTGVSLDIENLPLDHQKSVEASKTYDLYRSGKLIGVFQCESPGMQDTCVKVGVNRFEDIMAVIALYRPGPMENIPDYCDRKHGRKPLTYFHSSIAPHVKHILQDTYGVATYQEQLMRICECLGGMSLGEGYVVIKGVGKKKLDIIAKNKTIFVAGAVEKGVPKDVAEQYWEKFLVPFAGYGFNLAHSCCYAFNSYTTAFLKANYPEEFMCSYMNVETERRKMDRVAELEKETMRMDISISPRDINKCSLKWEIVRKKDSASGIKSELRPPIHCRGLSQAAAVNLVANRPYHSVRDLAQKTDSCVDAESIEALCDAKFFKTKKNKLLEEFKMIREDLKTVRARGRISQDMFA